MSDSFEQLLDRAASLFGIEPEFWDIFGTHHITSTEAKQAILSALGVATESAPVLERSLADLADERVAILIRHRDFNRTDRTDLRAWSIRRSSSGPIQNGAA